VRAIWEREIARSIIIESRIARSFGVAIGVARALLVRQARRESMRRMVDFGEENF